MTRVIFLVCLSPFPHCARPAVVPHPMPAGCSFTGVYDSPQYGELHLVQTGESVYGRYQREGRWGQIDGELDGHVLRFEWTENDTAGRRLASGRGHFQYLVDPANGDHVLKGGWGLDDDESGGEWNAYELTGREPHPEGIGVPRDSG